MNDLDHYITYRGREYRYDPDYDCFYPVRHREELSFWDQWAWIFVTALLAILAYWLSL